MYSNYELSWQDLEIQSSDIADSIGYPSQEVPARIANEIEKLWVDYRELIEPRVLVRSLPAQITADSLLCADIRFAIGRKIASQVAGLSEVALFVCTIGDKLEQAATRLTASGELMNGFVLDTIGSLAAERLAEQLQCRIETTVGGLGQTITTRFSPGYCDWHVSAQRQLFDLLGGTPCGVILSQSAMMKPLKSISGFVGIGSGLHKGYACETCEYQTKCLYRNKKANSANQSEKQKKPVAPKL